MPKQAQFNNLVQVKVNDGTLAALDAMAKDLGLNRADLVRTIVNKELQKEGYLEKVGKLNEAG